MIFDIETDGLLPDLTKIHCIGIEGHGAFRHIEEALEILRTAPLLVGHNIIGFDIPAIQKLYPDWKPEGMIRDTLVLARLFWPHIKDSDYSNSKLPPRLNGSQSLKAWGYRLNQHKFESPVDWSAWSQEMQDYMMQDVHVTVTLWERIEKEAKTWDLPLVDDNPPPGKDAVALEHQVAEIARQVEAHGFHFDFPRALELVAKLTQRKHEITEELHVHFPPINTTTTFTPKVNNKKRGYEKGVPIEKLHTEVFNPASRQQVGKRLKALGWEPSSFTNDGHPTVNDDVLTALPYPEAQSLAEYFIVNKRLGQIANGKEAWFTHLTKANRIHGRIHTGGAHTGRMTHSNPNMAQVPANHVPYGEECRACFIADEGWVLIGCDADSLENRCLSGFLAIWDDGAYGKALLEGDKEAGTDGHSLNAKAIGCDRDTAKTFLYALIYGAGDAKLGETLGKPPSKGKEARAALMRGLPALSKLTRAAQRKIENKGYLIGLDGRRLFSRSKASALNTLLQSAGAIIMKRALVLLVESLAEKGLHFGTDYAIVGLIHDEYQMTAEGSVAEEVGETARQAIVDAGTYYSFKCPLDAHYKTGANWSETH